MNKFAEVARYDLEFSNEFAENLTETKEKLLNMRLRESSKTILLSAAIPGQCRNKQTNKQRNQY